MTKGGSRTLVWAMSSCLLSFVALVPSSMAGPRERVHSESHDYVYQGVRTHHWDYVNTDPPPLVFHPRRIDRFVHFSMEDVVEDGVMIEARQEGVGNGKDLRIEGCGDSVSMNLVSRRPVEVYVYSGACRGHEIEFSSSGTITAEFSNIARDLYGEEHQH